MAQTNELSKREKEVVNFLMQGKSNKEIAKALSMAEGTVEFHLTKIYKKLGVISRAEAIIHLNQLGKSLENTGSNDFGEATSKISKHYGESPVENFEISVDNRNEPVLPNHKTFDMIVKINLFLGRHKTLIAFGIVLILIVIIALNQSKPKTRTVYEREFEHPDEYTVGQMIGRSNASGSNVYGQFGTTVDAPWPAQFGYVIYNNIKTPKVGQLFLEMRYSKDSPSSIPVLIYIDEEPNPRVTFYPTDLGNWNAFVWTEPILLGSINSGVHSILFYTKGQQNGVADLDMFILTAGQP